jgi:hypothetical protein
METALISIICIALMIFGGMTMAQGFMTSVDASTAGLNEIEQRTEVTMRTELTPISAVVNIVPGPDPLDIVLENTGQTKIADFERWDVIVQYYSGGGGGTYNINWLPYDESGAGTNEWGIVWIRLDGAPEVFEPDVLNPGEQIMIRTYLSPAVTYGTTNMVVISTHGGVTCSTYFTR